MGNGRNCSCRSICRSPGRLSLCGMGGATWSGRTCVSHGQGGQCENDGELEDLHCHVGQGRKVDSLRTFSRCSKKDGRLPGGRGNEPEAKARSGRCHREWADRITRFRVTKSHKVSARAGFDMLRLVCIFQLTGNRRLSLLLGCSVGEILSEFLCART